MLSSSKSTTLTPSEHFDGHVPVPVAPLTAVPISVPTPASAVIGTLLSATKVEAGMQ